MISMVRMNYIPRFVHHGSQRQDVASVSKSKTVSIQAFYIDQTEITNNEYRQFVYYVRDSIAKRILGDEDIGEHSRRMSSARRSSPKINWRERINWYGDESARVGRHVPSESEQFYRRRRWTPASSCSSTIG